MKRKPIYSTTVPITLNPYNPNNFVCEAYIYAFEIDPDCPIMEPFDLEQYKSMYRGCMVNLVKDVNPWNAQGLPNCIDSWSETYYRFFKATCVSDWFNCNEDGVYKKRNVPCEWQNLESNESKFCSKMYHFCWEITGPSEMTLREEEVEEEIGSTIGTVTSQRISLCRGISVYATNKYGHYVDKFGNPVINPVTYDDWIRCVQVECNRVCGD